MKLEKIDHIAINVINFEKSVEFYEKILGLKQLNTVDCGEHNITYFELPGNARLELFDYHGKNPNIVRGESDMGLRHLAFKVKGVADHEKELRALGVNITLSTCDLANLGARVLLFTDPNNVTIEFCENL
ncbi:MAG: VOC family protein [Ruminiclostridium sp.]